MTAPARSLTLRETIRAAPRWAALYLPIGGLDGLVEALWMFSLGWEAARAGAASGLVLAAGAVPSVVLVLWGGSLADRLGAHRVALWSMAARVLAMAAWAAVVISGASQVALIGLTAFVVGTIAGIHNPAVSAMPRMLVPPAGLEASTNAQRILVRLVQTIGPMLGGLVSAWAGMGTVVVAAAVIGLLPLTGFIVLRRLLAPVREAEDHHPAHTESGLRSALAGFGWVVRSPAFRRTVPVQAVINLTSASILMVALPRQARSFDWGVEVYGLASGAFGAGMLLGSFAAFSIRAGAPRRKVAVAVICAGLASVMVAVTGSASSPVVAVLAAGLMGLAIGPVGAILTGWTMATTAATDPAMYGRVYAVLLLVTVAAEPLGYLLFAAIATAASVAAASIAFGAVGVAVATVALGSRSVRVAEAGGGPLPGDVAGE